MSLPVYIIAGFLGAGKTTLLNNLLSTMPSGRKIAVMVNEFGKVGIDGMLIVRQGFPVKEVAGGCVCCTLRPELMRVLQLLASENTCDAIIIESTGLALPAEMAKDVDLLRISHGLTCAGIAGVADGLLYHRLSPARAMMVNRQLLESDVVLLNKTDLLDAAILDSVKSRLENVLGNKLPIVETSFGRIDAPLFFNLFSGRRGNPASPFDGHLTNSTTGFESIAITFTSPVDITQLKCILEKHHRAVVRAKGILDNESGKVVVQYSSSGFTVDNYRGDVADATFVLVADTTVMSSELLTNEMLDAFDGVRVH